MSNDPDLIAVDRPTYPPRYGTTYWCASTGVAATELLDQQDQLIGWGVVQDIGDGKVDRWSVDIWKTTDSATLDKWGDRIAELLGRWEDKPPFVAEIDTEGYEKPEVMRAALASARERVDDVRHGFVGDDFEDVRAHLRVAALGATPERQALLRDADKAIVSGRLEHASIVLDGLVDGPRQERDIQAQTLECLHGTRSREEFEHKLAERGFGLVATTGDKAGHSRNATGWAIEDRRDDKPTTRIHSLESAGLTEDLEWGKVAETWAGGRSVDAEPALTKGDFWSTKRPAADTPPRNISDLAQRADAKRNGIARAEAAVVATFDEQERSVIAATTRTLRLERARDGVGDGTVTLTQVAERLERDGVSFGVIRGGDGDGEIRHKTLFDRIEETTKRPPEAAQQHMKSYVAAHVWTVQHEHLQALKDSNGFEPEQRNNLTFEKLSADLASKGINVHREYDADARRYDYSYSANVAGVGHFHFDEKTLFGPKESMSMHALVDAGEKARFCGEMRKVLSNANERADRASPWKMLTSRDERIAVALREQGCEVMAMRREQIGRERDENGAWRPVHAVQYGIHHLASNRVISLDEAGFSGTQYLKHDGRAFDGSPTVQKHEGGHQRAKGLFDSIGQAWESMTSGRQMALNRTHETADRSTIFKPEIERPSWERGGSPAAQRQPRQQVADTVPAAPAANSRRLEM